MSLDPKYRKQVDRRNVLKFFQNTGMNNEYVLTVLESDKADEFISLVRQLENMILDAYEQQ